MCARIPGGNATFEVPYGGLFIHCRLGTTTAPARPPQEKQCAAANPPLIYEEDPRGAPFEGECVWPWESSRRPLDTPEADIAVTLSAPRGIAVGGRITYTVTGRHNGGAATPWAEHSVALPANVAFVSGKGCTFHEQTSTPLGKRARWVACRTDLTSGAGTATFTVQYALTSVGNVVLTAERYRYERWDTSEANNTSRKICTVLTGLILTC
nr:hypothetical protein [Streptomyces coryli]